MPRTKAPLAAEEKVVKKKKAPLKKASPKKKAKPVIVDVIEDEPLIKEVEETVTWPDFVAPEKEEEKVSEKVEELKTNSDELDQQKRFFSTLASQVKEKNNREVVDINEPEAVAKKNVGLYRRLVWKFLILVGALALIVAYFSFSQLAIIITPKGETLSDNLFLKINKNGDLNNSDASDPRETVGGEVKEISATVEKTYPASGEEFIGEEISGQVKIINNYNKSQALVATTRLLSPDNKMFRIKNAVNVPAGGEVTVDIYVDKPSAELAIGPTTFVIPGLWLGLQDKIFARSETDFNFRQKVKRFIKASDIEQATKDINELLMKTAKENGKLNDKNTDWLYDTSNQTTLEIGAKTGEAKDSFTIKASGKIVAVKVDKAEVAKLATAKLNLLIPDEKELTEFKPENITYSLESYDSKTAAATVKAGFTGTMVLKGNSEIINRGQLVNLTKEQIDNYLKDFPEIKKYELKFSPSFIKKAPSLVDRIKIKINKE